MIVSWRTKGFYSLSVSLAASCVCTVSNSKHQIGKYPSAPLTNTGDAISNVTLHNTFGAVGPKVYFAAK